MKIRLWLAVFPPPAELEPGTARSTGPRITYCATKAPLLHRKTKLVDFRTILVNILGAANFRITILTAVRSCAFAHANQSRYMQVDLRHPGQNIV